MFKKDFSVKGLYFYIYFFSTKVLYLKLVSDMETDIFLTILKNFLPQEIYRPLFIATMEQLSMLSKKNSMNFTNSLILKRQISFISFENSGWSLDLEEFLTKSLVYITT